MKRLLLLLTAAAALLPCCAHAYGQGQGLRNDDTALLNVETLGIKNQGAWSIGTTYAANDAVTYTGAWYVSIAGGNVGHTPAIGSSYWTSLSQAQTTLTAAAIAAVGALSNSITGNAATATALAATPNQCAGTSAPGSSGVAANGNANCIATLERVYTVATSGASQTVTLSSGVALYDVTLSANCAFSFAPSTYAGVTQRVTLIIRPSGFTATLPASSSTIVWPGGVVPVVSTSGVTVINFLYNGSNPIVGGI
jgi:hypothetical protein